MKDVYEKPEMEIVSIQPEDIIKTSGEGSGGEIEPWG